MINSIKNNTLRPAYRFLGKVIKRLYHYNDPPKLVEWKNTTSLTDNVRLPQFCIDAVNDFYVFQSFRDNPTFTKYLEHVPAELGEAFLDEIEKYPDLFDSLEKIKANDDVGGGERVYYDRCGSISPSTLRYAKITGDLVHHFGKDNDLSSFNIIEIGGGYGGQCRAICAVTNPSRYTLIDQRPMLNLAEMYLSHFAINPIISYQVMNQIEPSNYDLLISNYAFSELIKPIQDVYLERVVKRAKRGYMIYNDLYKEDNKTRPYRVEEIAEMIPGARILEEVPQTDTERARNKTLIWTSPD